MVEKELPEGWICTSLRNVVITKKGKKPKMLSDIEFENSVPYLDIKALEKNEIRQYADIESSNLLETDDIAILWDGARSGWVSKGKNGALGSTLAGLKPILVNTNYIYFFLKSKFNLLNTNTRGSGIPHVDPAVLWNLEFLLPSLAEQNRIVEKLDKLFVNIEFVKTKLDAIPQLLKDFRQAVLSQAVTGKLTENWREGKKLDSSKLLKEELERRKQFWLGNEIKSVTKIDDEKRLKNYKSPFEPQIFNYNIPNCWSWCTWDQLSNWITYGFTRPMPTTDSGIPKITVRNIRYNRIDFSNADYTSLEAFEQLNEKDKPKKGDILITKDGATLGRCAVVEDDTLFCIGQSVAVVWMRSTFCCPRYLSFVINSKFTQDRIWEVARGMGMPHLSITDFRSLSLGLPSLLEQEEIVRQVEILFAKADAIEKQYELLKIKISNLPQAILAKAFQGELVPQDPNDEPASELLRRIKEVQSLSGKLSKLKQQSEISF